MTPPTGPKERLCGLSNLDVGTDYKSEFRCNETTGEDGKKTKVTTQRIVDSEGKEVFSGTTESWEKKDGKPIGNQTKRSDGKTDAIEMPELRERIVEPKMLQWEVPSTYSLSVGAFYGRRGFKNEKALDHHDFGGRLDGGLKILKGPLQRHVLLPRLFYGLHFARNPISGIIKSEAQIHTFGLGLTYLYEAVPNWLWVGASAGLGASIARSKEDQYGILGVQYNDSNRYRPLNDSALHLELGAKACTWGMRICLDARATDDVGFNPSIGGGLNEHLDSPGLQVGLSTDIMQFFAKPTAKGYLADHGVKSPRKASK